MALRWLQRHTIATRVWAVRKTHMEPTIERGPKANKKSSKSPLTCCVALPQVWGAKDVASHDSRNWARIMPHQYTGRRAKGSTALHNSLSSNNCTGPNVCETKVTAILSVSRVCPKTKPRKVFQKQILHGTHPCIQCICPTGLLVFGSYIALSLLPLSQALGCSDPVTRLETCSLATPTCSLDLWMVLGFTLGGQT